ncbi:MAG: hypothetical protein DWQ07_08835 [Chloroflexi bacterium]|nr:MAG: hypothetical protein DWQ07_08835 [Chloroflexota bacterium]MBL1193183.1 hypothetical protein [Chloroflexota bacterium]NOH10477.1 hypothetical protein [Chloroflexota bacterium]
MKKPFPFHVVLFIIYPIIALYVNNINEITLLETLRSYLVSIVIASILFGVLYLFLRDYIRSALLTTWLMILFFSYGHVLTYIKQWEMGELILGRHRFLLPIWLSLFVIGAFWIARTKRHSERLNQFFNGTGSLLLLFSIYSIAIFYWGDSNSQNGIQLPSSASPESVSYEECTVSTPDIYYIILDGYGRNDILRDLYDFDNSKLTSFLLDKGFYIAENSYSNYSQTLLSLSSSLNMSYINYLTDELGRQSLNRDALGELVTDSQVLAFLKDYDYQFVTFETGAKATEIRRSDYYLSPESDEDWGQVNERQLLVNKFEGILIDSTLLILFLDHDFLIPDFVKEAIFGSDNLREIVSSSEYQKHRERIEYTFTRLPDFASRDGKFFFFAHVIAPHPPFVFDASGAPLEPVAPFSFRDGTLSQEQERDYIRGYRDQLEYINTLLIDTIESILAQSTEAPIIIVQGDHGPGSQLKWTSIEDTNLLERMGILNAIHLPGGPDILYPDISPVNTFRSVFNCYFDTDFELLTEKHYISLYDSPYDFLDITKELP